MKRYYFTIAVEAEDQIDAYDYIVALNWSNVSLDLIEDENGVYDNRNDDYEGI